MNCQCQPVTHPFGTTKKFRVTALNPFSIRLVSNACWRYRILPRTGYSVGKVVMDLLKRIFIGVSVHESVPFQAEQHGKFICLVRNLSQICNERAFAPPSFFLDSDHSEFLMKHIGMDEQKPERKTLPRESSFLKPCSQSDCSNGLFGWRESLRPYFL